MTLEQFIKNYNTTQLRKGELSYEDYLTSYEGDPLGSYLDTLDTLDAQYRRASSDFGARGESLGTNGLLGSGYAAYLDGNAYAELQRGRQSAKETVQKALSEGSARYATYLSEQAKVRADKLRQVKNDILDQNITDPDAAFAYAESQGLSREEADAVSQAGINLTQEAHQQKLMNLIIEKGLDADRAIALGIYYGLPRHRIDQIVHFANVMQAGGSSTIPAPDYYTRYEEYLNSLK